MVVLSAIGRFFKKIWDWIKQTAWIQPLLIVGIIFGVIFSIPSIVNGIKAANVQKNSADVYFQNYQYSLAGGTDSKADKLVQKIINPEAGSNDKFFLVFVEENNQTCSSMKGGFQVLQEKFGKGSFASNDDRGFKLITIFKDQVTSLDDNDDKKKTFDYFLDNNMDFFAHAGGSAYNTDYFYDGKISDSELENLSNAESLPTPTIMLIDLNPSQEERERGYKPGVTEVMFGLDGGTDFEKAKTLMDCWNHSGDFNSLD